MKRRKACAVLCTFSILSSLFTGTAAMAAPEEGQTETVAEQTEAPAEETDAPAEQSAEETDAPAEQSTEETDAPDGKETEESAEQSETSSEESTEQTEDGDAIKIDRDHPEGRIGVAYDQENAWSELTMANEATVDTGINIRRTADPEGEVLGYLYTGCAAWILNKGDEWTEIYSGGMTGFVKTEYLVFGEEVKALAQKYGTDGITAMWDGVAVFAEADGESEVVKVLVTGDDMYVIADQGHWLQVKLDEENVAYVSVDDVIRSLVLDSAVPKDGVYKDAEPAAEAEAYEKADDETSDENQDEYTEPAETQPAYTEPVQTEPAYTEPVYTEPVQTEPTYVPPQTEAPQTDAPQTEAPQTDAPQTEAPQTDAPQTEAPQTDAPQTEAPQTDAPQTEAPQTDAPQTDAPQTDPPVIDNGDDGNDDGEIDDIGNGDDGWYDADTDTYYDANGNVITQEADSQYVEDDYMDIEDNSGETYEETYAEETEAYVEETAEYVDYTGEEADPAAYAEETEAYVEPEEAYVEETEAYVEPEEAYVEETEAYVEPEEAYVEETEAYVEPEDTYAEETSSSAAADDTSLLAALIYCEAGNQSYEGMVAVGAVVMNRVYSSSFPNSISEVIYQSGQFTPASNGSLSSALASGVPSSCYEAASAALSGENPVGSALYFNAGSGTGMQIGDHQFY